MDDEALRSLLNQVKTIAVVGHSDKPSRPSYQIAQYLRQVGYQVHPVNPAVEQIADQPSYASLSAVPAPIELVDVFRRPEAVPEIVEAAIAVGAKALWLQVGVVHPEATARARAAGLTVVVDRCIMIEHQRLGLGGRNKI